MIQGPRVLWWRQNNVFSCFMHRWVALTRWRRCRLHLLKRLCHKALTGFSLSLPSLLFFFLLLIIFSVTCVCLDGGGGGRGCQQRCTHCQGCWQPRRIIQLHWKYSPPRAMTTVNYRRRAPCTRGLWSGDKSINIITKALIHSGVWSGDFTQLNRHLQRASERERERERGVSPPTVNVVIVNFLPCNSALTSSLSSQ